MRIRKKIFVFLQLVFVIVISGTFTSCTLKDISGESAEKRWHPPRPVRIDARIGPEEYALNLSLMSWISQANPRNPLTLLSRDQDALLVVFSEHDEIMVPYHWSDGAVISLEMDDKSDFLNDKRFSVFLSTASPGLNWIINNDSEQISQLRLCVLWGPVGGANSRIQQALRKVSKIKPDMAWVVDGRDALRRMLNFFDPMWLFITSDTALNADDLNRIAAEPNLEYLWLNVKNLNEKTILHFPNTLHSLYIEGWHPERAEPVPGELKSLRSLTIRDSSVRDLSGIAALSGLDELHMVSCPELTDISALSNFDSLKAITLHGCKNVEDLTPLKALKNLQWLGLPPKTSQGQFNEIIGTMPSLQVLELADCDNIRDITLLRSLERLESLVLLNNRIEDYGPLSELDDLHFVALRKETIEDDRDIKAMQDGLPSRMIVQAQPFCLGSGWILSLWPALLSGWVLGRRRFT